jgi:hypothetical protein
MRLGRFSGPKEKELPMVDSAIGASYQTRSLRASPGSARPGSPRPAPRRRPDPGRRHVALRSGLAVRFKGPRLPVYGIRR